jgi:2,3-bisphosphoglycerate-dependent phosphoglycerate mutase
MGTDPCAPRAGGMLVLVRHGESQGNRRNIFTGWRDLELSAHGREEALAVGDRLAAAGTVFDAGFSSALKRARETASIILQRLAQTIEVRASSALNERDYGELTGLSKSEAATRWGVEKIQLWRRSFDLGPPGGESLKDTANRVLPYYRAEILPHVLRGECVLVVAHGNSLRALVMTLDGLDSREIEGVEIRTGEIRIYQIDSATAVAKTRTLLPDRG